MSDKPTVTQQTFCQCGPDRLLQAGGEPLRSSCLRCGLDIQIIYTKQRETMSDNGQRVEWTSQEYLRTFAHTEFDRGNLLDAKALVDCADELASQAAEIAELKTRVAELDDGGYTAQRAATADREIEQLRAERDEMNKWFADNATVLATHRIGGYHFGVEGT